jgi:hypothetical protein
MSKRRITVVKGGDWSSGVDLIGVSGVLFLMKMS